MQLTNVARASLEELRLDYEDFLRQRGLPLWAPDDPRRKALVARRCRSADEVAAWVKETALRDALPHSHTPKRSDASASSIPSIVSMPSIYAGVSANAALVLIEVAMALLDRQLASQAAAFETEGGFTERLYKTRQAGRRQP